MARGAKPGENRFKNSQKSLTSFRLARLLDVVVPKLKALSAHTSISSVNKFCSLAAEIYNENLPVNEKPISYRRLNQNEQYWKAIGSVYYQHFKKKQNLEEFKKASSTILSSKRLVYLESQLERLKAENNALRNSLSSTKPTAQSNDKDELERTQRDIENMGRIIEILISKYGVIKVDTDGIALRDLADDLESPEGIAPSHVVKPYIEWHKNKAKLNLR